VDEELAVFLVLRMKGEAEQALFVFLFLVVNLGLDIEKRLRLACVLIFGEDQDLAEFGDDEQPVAAVARVRDGDRAAELEIGVGSDGLERQRGGIDAVGGYAACRQDEGEAGENQDERT
jgi:hypothetical protein